MQRTTVQPAARAGWKTLALAAALSLAACGGGSSSGSSGSGESEAASSGEEVVVGLITKTDTNPFFVTMKKGAQQAAETHGVDLQTFAGKVDGDNEAQVQAIENLISYGAK
ncbi:MAG: substrate-binding domain-containing protein, partial [Gammaproteobacteria bacterium]